jgi:hypothetical protein
MNRRDDQDWLTNLMMRKMLEGLEAARRAGKHDCGNHTCARPG